MRVYSVLILFGLLFSGCAMRKNEEGTAQNKHPPSSKTPYFFEVPIAKLSSIQSPCIDVEIESKHFSMELDLGFGGNLSIKGDRLDFLENKSFLFKKSVHGVRGKEYPIEVYRVPKVKIGQMTFTNPNLEKENPQFIKDSNFVADGGEPSPREEGRLGWELFRRVNLLIDMKNGCVAFCDSLENLATRGYQVENFIKTPLIIENGLLEIRADTPEGSMHYMLDTGATWNILNRKAGSNQTLDSLIWDLENSLKFTYFKIEDQDFGPISFHRMPIELPFHLDGILGIEFFYNNLVFLDFYRGVAYFCERPLIRREL